MAKDFLTEQLKQRFKNNSSFTKDALLAFYKEIEPDLKETTFRWRIHKLKEKKILRSIDKNHFTLSYKPAFIPTLTIEQKELFNKIEKNFPNLKYCIWSTQWIHEFMLHQPGKSIVIIEPEKEAVQSVFHFLQDNNPVNVYINPEEKEIDNYIFEQNGSIIVKPLISKSPMEMVENINTPALEKILVDIYSEKKLFNIFQGKELSFIFKVAFEKYEINLTKMLQYAKRRGKAAELNEYLSRITEIPKVNT